jgi:hypothetical protein
MWVILFLYLFFADMGSAFDVVEHTAKRRMGRYDHVLFHPILIPCRATSAGWWAFLRERMSYSEL